MAVFAGSRILTDGLFCIIAPCFTDGGLAGHTFLKIRFMKKILYFLTVLFAFCSNAFAVDASKLLPPEQAFVPQVHVTASGVSVQFKIADGYYMYQSKIMAATEPSNILGAPRFGKGEQKEDEFFGKQTVYHRAAQVDWPYKKTQSKYKLTLSYQGCAEVGVCYPPVDTVFDINGNGFYSPQTDMPISGKDRFLSNPAQPVSSDGLPSSSGDSRQDGSRFKLSRDTLGANLLAFFLVGLGLSFTACMYPLLPIVSSIVIGDKNIGGKTRAFELSMVYVQGLALTYMLVGVIAGLTGSLLSVWLQQPWVILPASALMVILALSMFGLFNIQLPASVQAYFQSQSNKLSGGHIVSVFIMGMLSALIVGPCVAPPLAFALGYIGQTGDAILGGLALYVMALGTGVPLIIVGTFGSILPRAGDWMNGVKYAFGFILLAVAVYLATPYLPYAVVTALYTLLLVVPAGMLLAKATKLGDRLKSFSMLFGSLLLIGGVWFGYQSANGNSTALHHFLTLNPPSASGHSTKHGKTFTDTAELKAAMTTALQANPDKPVLLDFYADWCISCREMEAYTFNQPQVHEAVDMERFFQINVTANTPDHQALMKEYGLFGPPGIFVIHADGKRSEPLQGFAKPKEFIAWYKEKEK